MLHPLRQAVWRERSGQPCRRNLPTTPRTSSPRWLKKRPPQPCRRVLTSESLLLGWGETDSFTFLYQNRDSKLYCFLVLLLLRHFAHVKPCDSLFLLLIFPFISCPQVFYFSFRVWMCHCSRARMRVPNLTSCSPTLPTAETCSNWREDRERLSATEEWVTVLFLVLDRTLNLN